MKEANITPREKFLGHLIPFAGWNIIIMALALLTSVLFTSAKGLFITNVVAAVAFFMACAAIICHGILSER